MSSLALELITTISVALIAVLIGVRLVNGALGLTPQFSCCCWLPNATNRCVMWVPPYHQSEDGVAALRSAQKIIDAPLARSCRDSAQLRVKRLSLPPSLLRTCR